MLSNLVNTQRRDHQALSKLTEIRCRYSPTKPIKRLLVKYKYPPDRQPEAIKLVMDQMESLAPRYAEERTAAGS